VKHILRELRDDGHDFGNNPFGDPLQDLLPLVLDHFIGEFQEYVGHELRKADPDEVSEDLVHFLVGRVLKAQFLEKSQVLQVFDQLGELKLGFHDVVLVEALFEDVEAVAQNAFLEGPVLLEHSDQELQNLSAELVLAVEEPVGENAVQISNLREDVVAAHAVENASDLRLPFSVQIDVGMLVEEQ